MNRNPDFAEVMRRNKETWRRQREGDAPPTPPAAEQEEPTPLPASLRDTLLGSSTLPATIDIAEGIQAQLGEIVVAAHKASGLSVEEWNALSDADRDSQLELEIGARRAETASSSSGPQSSATTPGARNRRSKTASPA